LAEIDCPRLIVWGERDPTSGAGSRQYAGALWRRSECALLADAGTGHGSNRPDVVDHVARFLARTEQVDTISRG